MALLIERLSARGVLTKDDAAELLAQANADSADARVQAAEAVLAAAKADAALAKAQAAEAQAAYALARAKDAVKQATLARGAAAQVGAAQIAAARQLLGAAAGAPVSVAPAAEPPLPEAANESNPTAPTPKEVKLSRAGTSLPTEPPVAQESASAPAPEVAPRTDTQTAPAPVAPLAYSEASLPPVRSNTQEPAGDQAVRVSDVLGETTPAAPSGAAATDSTAQTPAATSEAGVPPAAPPDAVADSGQAAPAGPEAVDSMAEGSGKAAGESGGATRVSDALGEADPTAGPRTPTGDQQAAGGVDASGQASQAGPAAALPDANISDASAAQPSDASSAPVGDGAAPPPSTVAEVSAPTRRSSPDGAAQTSDDTVRVAYVPEEVRNQITEEVKDEVIAQAHREGWGGKIPDWVTRITLYGDIRVRFEAIINHSTNDNTGAFPNYNAINTGAPFDISHISNPEFLVPEFDVDQNRTRERLRARLGVAVDLQNGFTAGLRIATGNDNNPVTENQTFGAAGNAQGGDFSKYSIWLDRAYIKYLSPGDTASAFSLTLGRFDNPFQSTTMMWANDLAFDGALLKVPLKAKAAGQTVEGFKPFLILGAFPVFNTDLNFASTQPAKYPSYDKWLEAVQAGISWKMGDDFTFKSAAALYYYQNIEGQLSAPVILSSASDPGSTDDSRPSFAQNGNTYMLLRDITPSSTLNANGTTNQWQYFGLATKFNDFTFNQEIDYNHFEPFQVALIGEYVKNLAFNQQAISAIAVNNLGTSLTTGGTAPFLGGNAGWLIILKVGDLLLEHGGDWNAAIGYRHVESDAVVDGFTDADFGGVLTGTNLKGLTLSASLAIANGVWLEGHWYAASSIVGPVYKNDTLQLDVNVKF
jgi:hypothetical protein